MPPTPEWPASLRMLSPSNPSRATISAAASMIAASVRRSAAAGVDSAIAIRAAAPRSVRVPYAYETDHNGQVRGASRPESAGFAGSGGDERLYGVNVNPSTGLAVLLGVVGATHVVKPDLFDAIVPRALPGPVRAYTVGSALAELTLAVGLVRRS